MLSRSTNKEDCIRWTKDSPALYQKLLLDWRFKLHTRSFHGNVGKRTFYYLFMIKSHWICHIQGNLNFLPYTSKFFSSDVLIHGNDINECLNLSGSCFWDIVSILSLLKITQLPLFFKYLTNYLEEQHSCSEFTIKLIKVSLMSFFIKNCSILLQNLSFSFKY